MKDTDEFAGAVRQQIDTAALEEYLQLNKLAEKPLTIKQFVHGQSNPSYLLVDARGRRYVLRKQPPGRIVNKSAHRVDREFAILRALQGKVPVPQVYILCTDSAVLGSPFYIMEFLQGRIFHSPDLKGDLTPGDRQDLWKEAIKTLAQLHALDPRVLGLPQELFNTTHIQSHFPRQMRTLEKVAQSQTQIVGPLPHLTEIIVWLQKHIPSNRAAIVHGDYKIDNLVYHPTENRIIGILDWELCTIGHPLADIGNLLQAYDTAGKLPPTPMSSDMLYVRPGVNGVPTLKNNLDTYARIGKYDPHDDWQFGVAYTHFRLAVILHGIAARSQTGQASSAQASVYGKMFPVLARLAYNATMPAKL